MPARKNTEIAERHKAVGRRPVRRWKTEATKRQQKRSLRVKTKHTKRQILDVATKFQHTVQRVDELLSEPTIRDY